MVMNPVEKEIFDVSRVKSFQFGGRKVLISAYLRPQDISVGSQGDGPTLKSLMKTITDQGGEVSYVPYIDFGFTGKLIGFMDRMKRHSLSTRISGSHSRWMYTALFHFITYAISKIDASLKSKLRSLVENGFDTYIMFYPYLFSTLSSLCPDGRVSTILYEVNIEKKFFQFQFSSPRFKTLKGLLLRLIGMMESKSIDRADMILTVASRDARELSSLYSAKHIRPSSFVEEEKRSIVKRSSVSIRDVMHMTSRILGPDTVKVTFMGSNYSLNVRAVEEVIGLARKLSDVKGKVDFIVVGNVHHSFNSPNEIPDNVIFTGFLNNYDEVMSASDFFIMFDYMGTGIESKSRVYSEYPGLTLALTDESDEYSTILKEKLVAFNSVDSMERYLKDSAHSTLRVPSAAGVLLHSR